MYEHRCSVPSDSLTEIVKRCEDLITARDLAAALREITAAIDRCPGFADLLHLRSIIWRLLGDYVRAATDYAACLATDPHHLEAERIRNAMRQVTDWFLKDRMVEPSWLPDTVSMPELRAVLDTRQRQRADRRARLDFPSCDLPCASQCCYFESEPHAYGVHVAPSQVGELMAWLEAGGLRPDDFLASQAEAACPTAASEHPEWFGADSSGARRIWYPRLSDRPAPDLPPDARPRNRDYRDLGWLTRQARACRFVGGSGCVVHEVGQAAALPTCRSFLCFTAFVFLVLRVMGVFTREELATWRIDDLHRAAAPALLALAGTVVTDEEVVSRETAARDALSRTVAADRRADAAAAEACLLEFEQACRSADAVRDDRLQHLRLAYTQPRREDCHG